MTAPGQVLIATSVLPAAIIYGTDVFPAIVPRPALALVDDRTLVSIMGRGHDVGGPEAARARRRRARRRHTGNCSDRFGPGTWPRLSLAPSRWPHWRAGSSFTLGSARRSTPALRPHLNETKLRLTPATSTAIGQRHHPTFRAADAGHPVTVHSAHNFLRKRYR